MESQISYIKMMKRDARTRGWVPLLTTVLLMIALPVSVLIQTENKIQWASEILPPFTETDMAIWFRELVGAGNGMTGAVTVFCALVIGMTGFSYLHSVEKTDFYYALPVKRSRFMTVRYISGALMFIIPYIVNYGLVILVGVRHKIQIAKAGLWYGRTMLVTMLFFLLFYTLTVLAMFLTGKLLAGAVLAVGFFSYGMLVSFVIQKLCIKYFATYLPLEGIGAILSPVKAYMLEGKVAGHENVFDVAWYLGIFAVIVGIYVLLLICARFRPAEAAERVIAFRKMEGIIKIAVAVPGALACGLIVFMNGAENNQWFVISCLMAAVIISFAVSFSYYMDSAEFFKLRLTTVISVLLVAGCLAVFHYDLPGYDSYLPKESQLSGMAVKFDGILKYYGGVGEHYRDAEQLQLDHMETAVTPEMYEEIRQIVSKQTERKTTDQYDSEIFRISVMYHLENGRKIYRTYYEEEERLRAFAKKMLNQEEYVEKLCDLDAFLKCTMQDGTVQDLRTNEIQLQFDEKELHELFALYAEELQNANFSQLIHEHMVGELSVAYSSAPEKDVFTTEYFTIYDSFDSVIEYLKKAGFELNQSYRPEEILSITVETYEEGEENVNREIITDSEQIHRLFPYLNKYAFGTIWYDSDAFVENMMLSVVWKDGNTSNYELRAGGEDLL